MLVFTRKRNEAIVIGDGIEVRVLRIGRDGVRLGVTAPAAVAVHRREIYEQICAENRTAAEAAVAGPRLIEHLRKLTTAPAAPLAPLPRAAAAPAGQPGAPAPNGASDQAAPEGGTANARPSR